MIRQSAASVAILAALFSLGCATGRPPQPFASVLPAYHEGERFIVVGDLQRTSIPESFVFRRESNDAERLLIVQAIADARPAFVAITGDMVFDGSSAAKWTTFDALCSPMRAAGIPVVAAFGNHEYWGGRQGEALTFARFPAMEGRHWYVVTRGPLRLIFLDGNIDNLSRDEWRAQKEWYANTLIAIDHDPEARGTLVLLHQPPYTNSTVTHDEKHVQKYFIPPLLAATKTLGMLAGHVHSYERFERDGRAFVVSGGGGGPRAPVAIDADRPHPDNLFIGPRVRPFHFTSYAVTAEGVVATVYGLEKGEHTIAIMDRFEMRWR